MNNLVPVIQEPIDGETLIEEHNIYDFSTIGANTPIYFDRRRFMSMNPFEFKFNNRRMEERCNILNAVLKEWQTEYDRRHYFMFEIKDRVHSFKVGLDNLMKSAL